MKKQFLLILFVVLCTMGVYGEKVVGNYTLSYTNKSYDINAEKNRKGEIGVLIQVEGERESELALIMIEGKNLEEFRQSLLQVKGKFEEWSNVVKDNKVTEAMSKNMDVKFPLVTVGWYGAEWYHSLRNKLMPKFTIIEDGRSFVVFSNKVTSSSNRYIKTSISLIFSNPQEINDLISQLDSEKIKSKLEKTEETLDLFK